MAENTDNNEELENNGDGETAEKVTPAIDSKYRMILLAAQRSKQLQRGANPRVTADVRKTKPTRIAMEELKQNKVHFEILTEEEENASE
jgi:DNA-directed RNA polymerase omega subunit